MHALLLGLWVGLVGDPPTVAVDIDALALPHASSEQLHGELITRLVESGHAVGSTGAVVVRLTGGGKRVHVEVQHGAHVVTRDVTGSGALLRLAAIHAVIDLLAGLDAVRDPDPALAAAPERSVVIDADPAAAAWMPEVIAALLDAGNVVKPSAEGAAMRICLGAHDEVKTIAVVPVAEPCPAGAASEDLGRDLVIALAAARARPSPDPAIPTKQEPERAADELDPPEQVAVAPGPTISKTAPTRASGPRWSGALGIAAGAQARLADAEALVLLHGDARHDSGAMITVRAELMPSTEQQLHVVDTVIAAGAGYAFRPRPRLRIELLAAAGVLVHSYRFHSDHETHVDFVAELPVVFSIAVAPRVELGISALAGVANRKRSHYDQRGELWFRDRWRFAGLIGLRFALGRKPTATKMAGGTR
jgi:hypothetical protein